MKALSFVSSALLSSFLVVSTAFGNEATSSKASVKSAESSVRAQIASKLTEVSNENQGEVYVYFTASPEVGFELLKVTGSDNQLVSKVENQLTKGKFSVPAGLKGTYTVKVSLITKE